MYEGCILQMKDYGKNLLIASLKTVQCGIVIQVWERKPSVA
jgi:hypothetical protein